MPKSFAQKVEVAAKKVAAEVAQFVKNAGGLVHAEAEAKSLEADALAVAKDVVVIAADVEAGNLAGAALAAQGSLGDVEKVVADVKAVEAQAKAS